MDGQAAVCRPRQPLPRQPLPRQPLAHLLATPHTHLQPRAPSRPPPGQSGPRPHPRPQAHAGPHAAPAAPYARGPPIAPGSTSCPGVQAAQRSWPPPPNSICRASRRHGGGLRPRPESMRQRRDAGPRSWPADLANAPCTQCTVDHPCAVGTMMPSPWPHAQPPAREALHPLQRSTVPS